MSELKLFTCTDCGGAEFYEGPHGGLAVNFACANSECRARYNDTAMGIINRHGHADPDYAGFNPARKWAAYGELQ